MGTAGIKSNISNFGAAPQLLSKSRGSSISTFIFEGVSLLEDQYDPNDPEQLAAQEQFFQWFYMAINVGSAFAYSFLTTLGTNGGMGVPKAYGYFAAYLIASGCMLLAVVSFVSVRARYRTSPLQRTSAMADVSQRILRELKSKREALLAVLGAVLAVLAIAARLQLQVLLRKLAFCGDLHGFSIDFHELSKHFGPNWAVRGGLSGFSATAGSARTGPCLHLLGDCLLLSLYRPGTGHFALLKAIR